MVWKLFYRNENVSIASVNDYLQLMKRKEKVCCDQFVFEKEEKRNPNNIKFRNSTKAKKVNSKSYDCNESFLAGCTVLTMDGKEVVLSDLWAGGKKVVLKLLPRLGCRYCKYDAYLLSELKLYFDSSDVEFVVVAFDSPDLLTFLQSGYWTWDLLIDPTTKVYQQARCHKLTKLQFIIDILEFRFWKITKFLTNTTDFTNTSFGDRFQLGGTFIIDETGKLTYKFLPAKLAMYPCVEEMLIKLGGDPRNAQSILKDVPKRAIFDQKQAEYISRGRCTIYKGKCTHIDDIDSTFDYKKPKVKVNRWNRLLNAKKVNHS